MKDMEMFNGTSAEEPTPIPGILPPFPREGLSDFDLIEEIITEDDGRSGVCLPGPPPPPADLLSHASLAQNHRALAPGSSPTSQPVLVARGTACKPNFSPMRQTACPSSRAMASAHPSRGAASSSSGPSVRGRGSACPLPSKNAGRASNHDPVDCLERVLEKPRLVVVEEPKDRGMRFRYECEGRSAGSILGASSNDSNKTQPAVEIQGSIEHLKRVTVTVSLVTKDLPHRPHPHCLVGKDCPLESGICVVSFNPHSNRRHSFANLGVQCVKRKDLDTSLQKRRSQNIDPFQTGHTKGIEDMDMNAVRLCFQCELEWDDGRTDSLNPVVSKPIYDKKATTTSQLKICNLNQYKASCLGKTEIYMLCDKVQKDDIEIIFRRGSWKANGEFAQTDVHRQIAIVFKTPPYQEQELADEVEVDLVLRRISDQAESEPVTFTYLPHNRDPYEVKRKRATIKSDISQREKPCSRAEGLPASDQALLFLLETQNMTPDERLHPLAAPPQEEMSYCEAPDPSNVTEEALINQLLDLPEFWRALSEPGFNSSSSASCGFNPPAEASSAFANANMSFPQNFGSYPQDFAHYNDLQFNMLVNENQNPPPEPQDGCAVQVKMEEDL